MDRNQIQDNSVKLSKILFEAIRDNDIVKVRDCIEQGVNLKLENIFRVRYFYDACAPLGQACRLGHEEIMEELLKSGADPNLVSERYGKPVMNLAADEGTVTLAMIQSLLSYGADANLSSKYGKTILHYLARGEAHYPRMTRKGILCAAKLLLDNGASCDSARETDYTPLYVACRAGNVDLVKLFIAEGADVNFDNGSTTMLQEAAASCNTDMLDLVLNASTNRHLSPNALIAPCDQNDDVMIAKILNTCDVNINMVLHELVEETILNRACGDPDITSSTVELLLTLGADVSAVSGTTGDTALHYAVTSCDCGKIRQLLSYNVPLNIPNNQNQTPLDKLVSSIHQGRYSHIWPSYHAKLLAFKILVVAGAKVTAHVQHTLNQLCINCPEIRILDFEISSPRSLKQMCRAVIRGFIPPVYVEGILFKLPLPKLLQQYLNFPDLDPLFDEYLKITS